MLTRRRTMQSGDTLIEVLFAITVFALVMVSAMAIMNQGTASSQRALETTLVRQEVDSQAEALRFMHESYVRAYEPGKAASAYSGPARQYKAIVDLAVSSGLKSATDFGSVPCQSPPRYSFLVNARRATILTPLSGGMPSTYSKVSYDSSAQIIASQSRGIWVEAIRSPVSSDPIARNVGFIDYHIRACWEAPGLSHPMNIGTIVRLYEPRG